MSRGKRGKAVVVAVKRNAAVATRRMRDGMIVVVMVVAVIVQSKVARVHSIG